MESRDAYFDEIYRANAAKLKRFLVVRIRSVSDMEDLYQEVWKRFYERTAVLRPQEPYRYLLKIAKSELYHRYKSQSRRKILWSRRKERFAYPLLKSRYKDA